MSNYILSYDLNGSTPTHAQMDKHIHAYATEYGRILETVWYIRTPAALKDVYEYMNSILSKNDRIVVIEAKDMYMRNLLISVDSIQKAWPKAA